MSYIPSIAVKLSPDIHPQIRLLLLGKPGSGKTYSVITTFPSPVVADFDNGLTNKDVRTKASCVLPFYDQSWVELNCKTKNIPAAFKAWLNTDARKLESDQTLVIDSLSSLQAAFHIRTEQDSQNESNKFHVWNEKLKFFRDVHVSFKCLKCHVVVLAHEKEERDPDTGFLLGKVAPFMTGGFVAELGSHFTDIFRAYSTIKKGPDGKPTNETQYGWQVLPDDKYDLKSRMALTERFVKPGFQIFNY